MEKKKHGKRAISLDMKIAILDTSAREEGSTTIAKVENGKCFRRMCSCLRCVDPLKPELSTFYKDKSKYIMGMLRVVGAHYDDLKRRYLWALDRMAEMTIKINRLAADQQMREAKSRDLGQSWKDFCRRSERHATDRAEKKPSSSFASRGIEDIDKLMGMMLLDNEGALQKENKKRRSSGRVYTKITRSPKLTTIEDLPHADECESGDHRKSSTGVSKMLQKFRKTRKNENCNKAEINQEMADASEIKMQIYALMAEVAERDELIDSLMSQMKVKDVQITRLLEIIQQEKCGLQNINPIIQSENSEVFSDVTKLTFKE